MLNALKIILLFVVVANIAKGEYCNQNYNCSKHIDTQTRKTILTCRLPAMPTFEISAPNVLESDGRLKRYFATNNTVCDVLGWMNHAVPFIQAHYGGMNMKIETNMTLLLSHLPSRSKAGATARTQIHLDTDITNERNSTNDNFDDDDVDDDDFELYDNIPDGNEHKHRMKYVAVHEFWHFVAFNTSDGAYGDWIQEGPARSFEDVVYDSEDPYRDEVFNNHIYKNHNLRLMLEEGLTNASYDAFVYYKELDRYCRKPNIANALRHTTRAFGIDKRVRSLTENCTGIPTILDDKLASTFVLYNWAMLYKKGEALKHLDGEHEIADDYERFKGDLPYFFDANWTVSVVNKKVNRPHLSRQLFYQSSFSHLMLPASCQLGRHSSVCHKPMRHEGGYSCRR